MQVINRWNRKTYKVIEKTDKIVTLQREDGTQFSIAAKDFSQIYVEKS
jgi:hypothetical protein